MSSNKDSASVSNNEGSIGGIVYSFFKKVSFWRFLARSLRGLFTGRSCWHCLRYRISALVNSLVHLSCDFVGA